MQEYLSNILPRLKRFTKKLNKIENFIEKTWIKYDINDRIEYTFEKDKSLIISTNGNAQTGTWKLLSTGKLHIKKIDGEEQLNPEFISEDIFILTKYNIHENVQLFINEKNVNQGRIKEYINIFIYERELLDRKDKSREEDGCGNSIVSFILVLITFAIIFIALNLLYEALGKIFK
jgi:hypothetical protein